MIVEVKPSSLTPNQRWHLVRAVNVWRNTNVVRVENGREPRPIDLRDLGAASTYARLIGRGLLRVVETQVGPRGGEYPQVEPTSEGKRVADYIVVNRLKQW